MIPMEIITLGVSTLVSALLKIWAKKQDMEREKHDQMMQALGANMKERKEIRQIDDPGFSWTRRIIALSCVFAIIVLPKMAALLMPHVPITLGWTESQGGLLSFFLGGGDRLTWHVAKGFVLTPLDTHLMSAIVGLYFGGSIVGHKR